MGSNPDVAGFTLTGWSFLVFLGCAVTILAFHAVFSRSQALEPSYPGRPGLRR